MTQRDTIQTTARRGRPLAVEPTQLATVALGLFERRGFDAVTMKQIADAAGVSQRTLFRLFPTKADLVWEGLHEIREVIAVQAEALRGAALSPAELLHAIAEPYLMQMGDPAVERLYRRRLRLIGDVPALLNHPALREIEAVFASLFAPQTAHPSLVARSVVAIGIAALCWWAEQNTGITALEALRVAFRGVAPPVSRRTRAVSRRARGK
ncbi:MAG: hypothetical protein DI536_19780 [Archangium gephyra]|uniref:HTH tetR-type domain-containing protein n=1 Tax=Archangium gephyra TaxID=48 RepID=A0A2W5T9A9_9BACT|nr:MAG: hypothetical protein DI536_19780 [Archangium gephyra]